MMTVMPVLLLLPFSYSKSRKADGRVGWSLNKQKSPNNKIEAFSG
jgi:hypothetical protein